MPLNPNASVSENIRELHEGKTFRKTKHRFGKKKADKQAVAIAMNEKRKSSRKRRRA